MEKHHIMLKIILQCLRANLILRKKKKMFKGSIGRLLVVAGPSGSGKTTFLHDSARYLNVTSYPPDLEDFHDVTKDHIEVMRLGSLKEKRYENLCLHVDLTNPIRWCQPRPQSHTELEDFICPEMYENWEELNQYLRQAEQLDIVTYFVSREVHFSRLFYNKNLRNFNGIRKIDSIIAAVASDSTDNSSIHRKVYRAWIEYATSLESRSMNVIDANTDEYKFIEESEFLRQI